jgi:uncharacterized membrane protein
MLDLLFRALGALCHQLPAHSLTVHGQPLPLCARCTGLHVAGSATLLYLALARQTRRRRGLPGGAAAWALCALAGLWAFDGLNSALDLVAGRRLYPPSNILRLVTGMGMGIFVGMLLYPALGLALGRAAPWRDEPVARRFAVLLGPALAAVAGVALVLLTPWAAARAWLLFAAALALLAAANGLLATQLVARLWPVVSPRAVWVWPAGAGLGLLELALLAWLRARLGG